MAIFGEAMLREGASEASPHHAFSGLVMWGVCLVLEIREGLGQDPTRYPNWLK